jgi:hypothetical protein
MLGKNGCTNLARGTKFKRKVKDPGVSRPVLMHVHNVYRAIGASRLKTDFLLTAADADDDRVA